MSSLIFGTFYQGNSVPISGTDASNYLYPSLKPFLFALSQTDEPIGPANYLVTDLPPNFEHGDTINSLPAGQGYLRLLHGSDSVSGSSWDADLTTFGSTIAGVSGNNPAISQAVIRNKSELWTYWDHSVSMSVSGAAISGYLSVNSNNLSAASSLTIDTINPFVGVGEDANILKFRLNRDTSGYETITLTVSAGLAHDSLFQNNLYASGISVIYHSAKNCYIMVVNRWANKNFRQDDILRCFGPGTNLTDQQIVPNVRTVLDVLPMVAKGNMPHKHLTSDSSSLGGGPICGTPPYTPAESIIFGYSDIIPGSE